MGKYTRPTQELIDRMVYHTAKAQSPARRLEGLTFVPFGQQRTEAQDTLPYCEFKGPVIVETLRAGARRGLTQGSMTFGFEIAVQRTKGHPELMAQVEKVMDALETDTFGNVNPSLNGTLKPFSMSITSNFALDLTLNAVISLTVEPLPSERGQRRI